MATYRPSAFTSTPLVLSMLVAFAVVFFLAYFGARDVIVVLFAWPATLQWFATLHFWQALTFPFVHVDFIQAAVDGLVLYFFGGSLERAWGSQRFAIFFVLSGIITGLAIMAVNSFGATPLLYGMIGIFVALVVAFAALNPFATVYLIIFPLQARWLAAIVIAFELFADGGRYGGPIPALVVIGAVALFAWAFTTYRPSLPTAGIHGPGMRERFDRWQQRRRMRAWQRRVSKIDKPEDLFKR